MKKINLIILSIFISLTITACAQEQVVHHWEYEGEHGPKHWENLNPEFSLCGNGLTQSPIEMSETQIKKFESVIGFNSRPTQPINKRFVLESQ